MTVDRNTMIASANVLRFTGEPKENLGFLDLCNMGINVKIVKLHFADWDVIHLSFHRGIHYLTHMVSPDVLADPITSLVFERLICEEINRQFNEVKENGG